MTDLRDFLLGIAKDNGINITPPWRPLMQNGSHLMARDYNDVVNYCITLFSEIKAKYPTVFFGDIEKFKQLPVIKMGDSRSWKTTPAKSKLHCFPEWDELIDAIKAQQIIEKTESESFSCCTWSVDEQVWFRGNLPIYLLNSNKQDGPIDDIIDAIYLIKDGKCVPEVSYFDSRIMEQGNGYILLKTGNRRTTFTVNMNLHEYGVLGINASGSGYFSIFNSDVYVDIISGNSMIKPGAIWQTFDATVNSNTFTPGEFKFRPQDYKLYFGLMGSNIKIKDLYFRKI
jgi:hypothetical protein